MSNKMNYGKKFNGHSWVGGPVGYTPTTQNHFKLFRSKRSAVENALIQAKGIGNTKASKARVGKLPNGDHPKPKVKSRTEYEKEFGALIAEVVSRLERGLEELNMAPTLAKGEVSLINRRQVIEAIGRLKGGFYRTGQGGPVGAGSIGLRKGKYE